MTKKPPRFYGSGDLHFVTSSCYHRQPFLNSAHNRDLFLSVLETMRRSYHFVVVGYVVMPEHFHLLLSEPQRENISTVIQALKLGFARRLLNMTSSHISKTVRCGPPQHVWQHRFYDFNVWTEKKRIEKLRYIHRNPVKRGLVQEPQEWQWSSFRAYFFDEEGPVKINDTSVFTMKVKKIA